MVLLMKPGAGSPTVKPKARLVVCVGVLLLQPPGQSHDRPTDRRPEESKKTKEGLVADAEDALVTLQGAFKEASESLADAQKRLGWVHTSGCGGM